MTQHYDVAVIGGQLSGLIAAALLGKRGRRVVLIDHGENTTFYRRGGLRLPLVPTLIPAVDSSPVMQKVHDELGVGPELRSASRPLAPSFQAVLPHHRLDLFGDRQQLVAELGQEFPELSEPAARLFDRLFALDEQLSTFLAQTPPCAPANALERLRCRGLLRRTAAYDAPFEAEALFDGIPADHPLREILLGPLAFFAHLYPDAPSTLHAVRLVARYFHGTISFTDRLGGLRAQLWQAAETAGVERRRGAVVKAVRLHGGRLHAVELDGQKTETTADFFIANTFGPFHDLLPPHRLQARYGLGHRRAQPSGSLLVVNLVVNREVIPRGMAEAVFLLNGRRKPRGEAGVDPPLLVRRYPARRGEVGKVHDGTALDDPTREVLSCAFPVQVADVAHAPERLAALRQQALERVGRLVPFLRSHLRDTSLPTDTAGWELDSAAPPQRIDPWRLHPIFEPPERPWWGVACRAQATPFANLVHCGQDVLPGLGLEGEYLSGSAAAELLARRAGKAWRR